jgi:hypothetical protein
VGRKERIRPISRQETGVSAVWLPPRFRRLSTIEFEIQISVLYLPHPPRKTVTAAPRDLSGRASRPEKSRQALEKA